MQRTNYIQTKYGYGFSTSKARDNNTINLGDALTRTASIQKYPDIVVE